MSATALCVNEMQARFNAYDDESRQFLFFGGWVGMSWPERNERQAEIDRRHGYVHGWIIVDGISFDRYQAFPNQQFLNV